MTKIWIDLPLISSGGGTNNSWTFDAYGNPITSTGTSLNVNVTNSVGGVGLFYQGAQVGALPNTEYALISQTLVNSILINRIIATSTLSGKVTLKINSTIKATFRTGPAEVTEKFEWTPGLPAASGDLIEVLFKSLSGSPTSDVEAYFQASIT